MDAGSRSWVAEPVDPGANRQSFRGDQPGPEDIGTQVHLDQTGEIDPLERDLRLQTGDLGFDREWVGDGWFHVEHDVDLVSWPAALLESCLADEHALKDLDGHAALFHELASNSSSGGLAELDVAAGEVVVPLGDVSAGEDRVATGENTTGDELDVRLFGHCWNIRAVRTRRKARGKAGTCRWKEGGVDSGPPEGVCLMSSKSRPRLGRGLSALLGQPVSVEPQVRGPDTIIDSAEIPVASTAPNQLQLIRISDIEPSRFQPRQVMDEAALERLAASIRVSGVIQPVAVRASSVAGGRTWELVAGERRWRAATRAGLEFVPSVVVSLDDRESAEWGLIENVQREDLNAIERGWALRRMVEHFELAHDAVAERVGLERSSVTNLIRLTELESPIQDLIARNELGAGHGKALLAFSPGAGRVEAAKRAAANKWSVRKLEQLSRAGSSVPSTPATTRSVQVADLERQLGEHLGTRVRIATDKSGVRGRLVISFFDLDQFDGVLAKLGYRGS